MFPVLLDRVKKTAHSWSDCIIPETLDPFHLPPKGTVFDDESILDSFVELYCVMRGIANFEKNEYSGFAFSLQCTSSTCVGIVAAHRAKEPRHYSVHEGYNYTSQRIRSVTVSMNTPCSKQCCVRRTGKTPPLLHAKFDNNEALSNAVLSNWYRRNPRPSFSLIRKEGDFTISFTCREKGCNGEICVLKSYVRQEHETMDSITVKYEIRSITYCAPTPHLNIWNGILLPSNAWMHEQMSLPSTHNTELPMLTFAKASDCLGAKCVNVKTLNAELIQRKGDGMARIGRHMDGCTCKFDRYLCSTECFYSFVNKVQTDIPRRNSKLVKTRKEHTRCDHCSKQVCCYILGGEKYHICFPVGVYFSPSSGRQIVTSTFEWQRLESIEYTTQNPTVTKQMKRDLSMGPSAKEREKQIQQLTDPNDIEKLIKLLEDGAKNPAHSSDERYNYKYRLDHAYLAEHKRDLRDYDIAASMIKLIIMNPADEGALLQPFVRRNEY